MKAHVNYFRGFIALALGLTFASGARATELTDSAEVMFRQGRAQLDRAFGGNGSRLDSMAEAMRADSHMRVRSITVTGSASPEGSVEINRSLSRRRADAIFSYFGLTDSLASFNYIGRDWAGLQQMVETDTLTPARAQVLSLLDEINGSLRAGEPDNASNLRRLKELAGGRPYAYMYSRMFPSLRFSRLTVDFEPEIRPMIVSAEAPAFVSAVALTEPHPTLRPIVVDNRKPFYMALKTNLLYDALAIPNIGAEFYLGRNWSIQGNWAYGWWDKDRTHHYWRAYGGEAGLRRWLGSAAEAKPLTGHHLGIVAGVFTYDFELGGKGYMGGKPGHSLWDRCLATAGVEYGYSLPIARRLNLDFSIALGYAGGKVVEYTPRDGQYVWERTKHVNWFGPTKAEISLVWLIGHGNTNPKKGGAR